MFYLLFGVETAFVIVINGCHNMQTWISSYLWLLPDLEEVLIYKKCECNQWILVGDMCLMFPATFFFIWMDNYYNELHDCFLWNMYSMCWDFYFFCGDDTQTSIYPSLCYFATLLLCHGCINCHWDVCFLHFRCASDDTSRCGGKS